VETKNSSTASYEDVKELFLKVRALKEAIADNRLQFYKPIGRQRDFHRADTAEVRVVMGGNRSGKTTSGAAESAAHSLGHRPWLDPSDENYWVRLANGDPIPVPNVGRIVCENFEVNVVQTIHPKMMEWAPKGAIKHIQRNQRGVPVRYDWECGSVTHLLSYDQDDRAFEGPNGHHAWFDEPPPQRKFNGIRRGLIDFDGHCWLTMTPLAEPWINEVLVDKANDSDGRIAVFYYSIWDNCIENGGTLSRRAINSFLEDLPDDERQAREFGLPLHLAGLVFPEWRPERPFYVSPFDIPRSWPRVCVVDPHPRKPVAVLWAAVSPDDIVYVYRSLFDRRLRTIEAVAAEMHAVEGRRWDGLGRAEVDSDTEDIALRIIDTSANEPERTSGLTVAEQFMQNGIYCVDANKRNKDAGFKAIHSALRVRSDWQKPGLVVFNTCPEVKQNFLNLVWERWGTGRQQGLKGDKQEAVKNHDDFIDCIRYIFQMRLTYKLLRGMGRKNQQLDLDADGDVGTPINLKPGRPQWVKPSVKRTASRWRTSRKSSRRRG
jgi:hypothetical protein